LRILFDQAVPAPLREYLPGHDVHTAHELGWSTLGNSEFLARAEKEFEVLISMDRDLVRQLNLSPYRLTVLLLPTASWPRLRDRTERIAMAVVSFGTTRFTELKF
jgi:predicted nuclease of predicted toxin-antitoxin system